ncbi:helix-turn-helix transcriptional regulator [Lactobacillus sp. UCMA15818]|uniref:helix-turn-helix domain-containing protein n=1 Tax=Lactobacillus sp. UCMA15818 TaxID=2583394 RepID=UPI0025AEEE15|nr:helix-turn-helix transcriptional regulator [Lactobacillus sp. UCMA15818]MDN2453671.1 helix-turn-helix transcriptional regulator [Lactobacillus sp. UCMA15818]
MKFGERLKRARIEMDLTQEQVANDFFITRQTISSWENEKTYPDISSLIKLSDYYHISLDILLKEDVGMRESLEKKEVSEELRPVRRNLLLIDVILLVVLLGNLFDLFKISGGLSLFILLILLCTISALSDLNNFDKAYSLGLKYEWQKYISGDKGKKYALILPTLFVIIGAILLMFKMMSVGLQFLFAAVVFVGVILLENRKK